MYYPGTITEIDDQDRHVITYDDGDIESLTMDNEQWRYTASASTVSGLKTLTSNSEHTLSQLLETFGNKPFMLHHAQGFCQAPLIDAYKLEEDSFKQTVREVHRDNIPQHANIISSHTIYKIKINDDQTLKLKARIAPHGNEDSLKNELKSDCCMCAPVGIRIILMVATLNKWKITRADVKSAFLQTGTPSRDVYVIPPRESKRKNFAWLLLAAAYGLVNANAKWQDQSDKVLLKHGLIQCKEIPQLFYQLRNGKLILLLGKIVDDLIITGIEPEVNRFVKMFNSKFKLGSVMSGPGSLRFYGLNIHQSNDMSSVIDGNEKLQALQPVPLTRTRRKASTDKLNDIEKTSYMSIASSINWLGMTASLHCAYYSSLLQQRIPDNTVSNLQLQQSVLRKLQKIGTTTAYPRPPLNTDLEPSIVVFADAGRHESHGQLCYISGLLLGPLCKESTFYTLSWASHKSRRPVKSIGAAEIMAVGEAIDDGKVLKSALSTILGFKLQLTVITDSKDLYTSLSTQRNSVDKSIRADVNVIRFEYETHAVDTVAWIPGRTNPADVGTKRDSPLCDALSLMLFTGKLSLDFNQAEFRSADRSLG